MIDFGLCRINRNDAQRTEVGNPSEHPVLIHFMASGAGEKDDRRKMSTVVKELRRRGFKTRHRSWGAGAVRFCAIATNAPVETARDAASDHFTKVEVDLRPMHKRIKGVDVILLGEGPTE